jgi:serine/threonine protein kinase
LYTKPHEFDYEGKYCGDDRDGFARCGGIYGVAKTMSQPDDSLGKILERAMACENTRQRAEYLDETCGNDLLLRTAVEELVQGRLKAREALGEQGAAPNLLLGQNPAGAEVSPPGLPGEPTGERIGRYVLLQKIGEGGYGAVYMAEQEEPVRRRVALKVIKLGMDTKAVIARFEAERQALALMDHANIAKVLDAGATEAGRPYFVMELVRGIKFTQYCDQNKLGLRQRLELFIQICQAIQHAHQKGIIHRDIKPSNILVTLDDEVPVPKVIDFGVAKATTGQQLTDMTLFTAYQQFIGTPAYMSPEQAGMSELDVDTRSDIYSLGVLLYELLTGRTPFDPKDLMESGVEAMRKIIREKDPVRPSTKLHTLAGVELTTTALQRSTDPFKLAHLLKGDLDWIVMKCLEKDRTRRYETANGLATDLKRYLNNEPVLARSPSTSYRLGKFLRRNRGPAAAFAAVLVTLIAGLAAFAWKAKVATDKQHEAQVAQMEARKQAKLALDTLYALVTTADEKLMGRADAAPLRRELLELALTNLDRIAKDPSNAGLADRTIGVALQRLGGLYDNYTNSVAAYERSLAIFEKLRSAQPDEDWLAFDAAISHDELGEIGRETEPDPTKVLAHYQQSQSLRKTLLQHPHNPQPSAAQRKRGLAVSSIKVASFALELGDPQLAQSAATDALRAGELLGQESHAPPASGPLTPEQISYLTVHATALRLLGQAEHCLGHDSLAREHAAKCIEEWDRLLRNNPGYHAAAQDLARAYDARAQMEMDNGEFAQSLSDFQKAEAGFQELIQKAPDNPELKWFRANFQYRLACLLEAMGQPGSQPLLEKCLETRRVLRDQDSGNIQREVELMQVLARTGGLREADQLAEKVLAYAPRHPGKLFQTACAKAQCARRSTSQDASDRTLSERYAGQAVAILARAVDSGWRDAHTLAVAPDLAPLRERDDFKALCKKTSLR